MNWFGTKKKIEEPQIQHQPQFIKVDVETGLLNAIAQFIADDYRYKYHNIDHFIKKALINQLDDEIQIITNETQKIDDKIREHIESPQTEQKVQEVPEPPRQRQKVIRT